MVNVAAAVMVLSCPPNKIPKDRSWNAGKVMMSKVSNLNACVRLCGSYVHVVVAIATRGGTCMLVRYKHVCDCLTC